MSSPLTPKHICTVSIAMLAVWIPILSFALSRFCGTGFTSGWLIAGAMISIVSISGLLVLKEIFNSFLTSTICCWCKKQIPPKVGHKIRPRPESDVWENPGSLLDASFAGSRRVVLGLRSDEVASNRHRKPAKLRQSSDEFADPPVRFRRMPVRQRLAADGLTGVPVLGVSRHVPMPPRRATRGFTGAPAY